MCLNFGTPKIINLPFGTNGKLVILVVPIIKHKTVFSRLKFSNLILTVGILKGPSHCIITGDSRVSHNARRGPGSDL